jgi:UDP-3-O-[3-hydroxymyristoyl] glucosamine N-acyltransferase
MPVFFRPARELTIGEIATLTGAEPQQPGRHQARIANIAPLDRAGPADLSFLDNAKYAEQFAVTRAGACLVAPRLAAKAPAGVVVLLTAQPYPAFVAVARALFPAALRPSSQFGASGVAAGALVHAAARLEADVTVDPAAVVGPGAEIGTGTVIAAGAVIGARVRIGRECAVGAGAAIANALIGDRVIVHPGARIGQDGFGYIPGPHGHTKIPQVGRAILQDDVEIGANATVDRGSNSDTVIGEGTKIDNFVQIAHNVVVGRHCLIAAQVGISGSCRIGDFVMLGGQVGLADHVSIGAGAMVAAQSGVMSDIPAGAKWGGCPAQPVRDWMKGEARLRRLARGQGDDA